MRSKQTQGLERLESLLLDQYEIHEECPESSCRIKCNANNAALRGHLMYLRSREIASPAEIQATMNRIHEMRDSLS